MDATNGYTVQRARQVAEQIAQRAKSDPTYAQELRSDPATAAQAAGMPEEAIGAFLREEGLAEVSGYRMEDEWCVCTDCCITEFFW
jgi:hypothetical protein